MAVVESEASCCAPPARGPTARPAPSSSRKRGFAVLRPGWWSLRPGWPWPRRVLVLVVGAGIGGIVASGGGGPKEQVFASVHGHAKLIKRASGHSTLTATKLSRRAAAASTRCGCSAGATIRRRPTRCSARAATGPPSVDVPGSLEGVDKVLVTSEPEGGSEEPTTAPVIEVNPA